MIQGSTPPSLCQYPSPDFSPWSLPAAAHSAESTDKTTVHKRHARRTRGKKQQLLLAPPSLQDLDAQLRSIILSMLPTTPDSCVPEFRKFACSCGFHVVRKTCMHYDCPDCSSAVATRRALRVRDRLQAGRRGRPVCYTVVTIPPALRAQFADTTSVTRSTTSKRKGKSVRIQSTTTRGRLAWTAFRRNVWQILKSLGADFAMEATHPVGTVEDGEDPALFHPHLNFLWVPRPGRSAFINVATLRRLVAMALTGSTGRTGSRLLQGAAGRQELEHCLPVVFHRYWKDRGEDADLFTRVKYICRPFPGFSSWVGCIRWFGNYPKHLPVHLWCCPTCHQVYMYMGISDRTEYDEYRARSKLPADCPVDVGTHAEMLSSGVSW